jgi:hypothetical protein
MLLKKIAAEAQTPKPTRMPFIKRKKEQKMLTSGHLVLSSNHSRRRRKKVKEVRQVIYIYIYIYIYICICMYIYRYIYLCIYLKKCLRVVTGACPGDDLFSDFFSGKKILLKKKNHSRRRRPFQY